MGAITPILQKLIVRVVQECHPIKQFEGQAQASLPKNFTKSDKSFPLKQPFS